MKFKAISLNMAVAASVAVGSTLTAAPSEAATLFPGTFTLTGENVSRISDFSGEGDTEFTLNFDFSPLSISDTSGVFTGGRLAGTPNLAPLKLTGPSSGSGEFSYEAVTNFITGLTQDGDSIFFDLDAGSLFGFIRPDPKNTSQKLTYSFGGNLTGILREVSSSGTVATGSAASFDVGNGSGSNRSSITLETVPTPALLPGLLALGASALRKRNEEEAETVTADV